MRLGRPVAILAIALLATPLAPNARAFDHRDGPAASADPALDIAGLYTWVHDGKLAVVLDVFPGATGAAAFSTDAAYVVHVSRGATYGGASDATTLVCTFDAAQAITCWPGDDRAETTTGDASDTAGLSSASGKFRVFAGLRADPEHTNHAGLNAAVSPVRDAAFLIFDAAGCPTLDAQTSSVLISHLGGDGEGGGAQDTFATRNVLSVVMDVDLTLLAGSGDILGVWASTNEL